MPFLTRTTSAGVRPSRSAISAELHTLFSSEAMARQPEATSQIRTTMMMGLVFIETVIIYALIVAILIIFVL